MLDCHNRLVTGVRFHFSNLARHLLHSYPLLAKQISLRNRQLARHLTRLAALHKAQLQNVVEQPVTGVLALADGAHVFNGVTQHTAQCLGRVLVPLKCLLHNPQRKQRITG